MRVTDKMMSRQSLNNITKSFGKLGKAQDAVGSGKAINKPSDSPDGTARALRLRTQIRSLTQYAKNVDDASDMLDLTDLSLDQVSQLISRMKDLSLGALNGTSSDSDLKAAGAEVKELSEALFQQANTEADGRYLFSGDMAWSKPFNDAKEYVGGATEPTFEISKDTAVSTGLVGRKVFTIATDQGDQSLFTITDKLKDALNGIVDPLDTRTPREVIEDSMDLLSKAEENILSSRVSIGTTAGRLSRLEGIKDRLGSQKLLSEEMLTNIEYADFAEAASYLAEQETVYQSALAVAAKAAQRRTLVDYLR